LNAAGVTNQEIELVADGSMRSKKILAREPNCCCSANELARYGPSDVLVLPWNLASEISVIMSELVPDARCWKAVPAMTLLGPCEF